MALLLSIDTATELASVSLSVDGRVLAYAENEQQKEHASFVHAAIRRIVSDAGIRLADVDAFAVTSGPGSYTGLRVGMAAAKGFCYAFNKPLITINTLAYMAGAAIHLGIIPKEALLCPMIDARRMEVFTAIYDHDLNQLQRPQPVILEANSFAAYINIRKMFFFGSGSNKFKDLITNENATFISVCYSAKDLAVLAEKAFDQKNFSDVSYSEPEYFKDFHTTFKR